jgi:hypothetical protein
MSCRTGQGGDWKLQILHLADTVSLHMQNNSHRLGSITHYDRVCVRFRHFNQQERLSRVEIIICRKEYQAMSIGRSMSD